MIFVSVRITKLKLKERCYLYRHENSTNVSTLFTHTGGYHPICIRTMCLYINMSYRLPSSTINVVRYSRRCFFIFFSNVVVKAYFRKGAARSKILHFTPYKRVYFFNIISVYIATVMCFYVVVITNIKGFTWKGIT